MTDKTILSWAQHHYEPGMCPECEGYGCKDCAHTGRSDVGPQDHYYGDEEPDY